MSRTRFAAACALLVCAAITAPGGAFGGETPDAVEQMASLQAMCADSATARAQRHAAAPLYERLGGYARIHELTTEIVRLHHRNDAIKHMFVHVDDGDLAKQVADFVASGTGGPQAYSGRDLPSTHGGMGLTDADFLAAGSDIISAMQSLGYGQEEIDEVVCILVSLKDQVVFE